MKVKLFQKLTIQDIISLEDVSSATAKSELKDIRSHFNLKKVRLVHYFIFNGIDFSKYPYVLDLVHL